MRFTPVPLPGAWLIEPEQRKDERGWFARSWCAREFEQHGLDANLAQCNISWNATRGTLRGMHFQKPPHTEAKLVRCTSGAVFDVIIDLRPESTAFQQWYGVELSSGNYRMLYIPDGFAHGFQTLTDGAEVFYQMSEFYQPNSGSGVRWNDPAFGINWPLPVSQISAQDSSWPDCHGNR